MISIHHATNWKGERGYRWMCSDHPHHTGFHRFDRFTDRVRRTPDRHPWDRAMSAAVCHYHKHHNENAGVVSYAIKTRPEHFRIEFP